MATKMFPILLRPGAVEYRTTVEKDSRGTDQVVFQGEIVRRALVEHPRLAGWVVELDFELGADVTRLELRAAAAPSSWPSGGIKKSRHLKDFPFDEVVECARNAWTEKLRDGEAVPTLVPLGGDENGALSGFLMPVDPPTFFEDRYRVLSESPRRSRRPRRSDELERHRELASLALRWIVSNESKAAFAKKMRMSATKVNEELRAARFANIYEGRGRGCRGGRLTDYGNQLLESGGPRATAQFSTKADGP